VAFSSEATNLVPGDSNGFTDVFVHDQATDTTTRVSAPLFTVLTIIIDGLGTGVVSSDDGRIRCPGDCSAVYDPGTVVTLSATASEGSMFAGWAGDCWGTGGCRLTMNADQQATAMFVEQRPSIDLVVSALSDPPALAAPGDAFTVTDTTMNLGALAAGPSTTRYYLSPNPVRDAGDLLLTGVRTVTALAGGATSNGATEVRMPRTTVLGMYFLLACADDQGDVVESDETNNCRASATGMLVTLPDLVTATISAPPANVPIGGRFTVTDTAANIGSVPAGTARTRYYLSLDTRHSLDDIRLSGTRVVESLQPAETSTGTRTLRVPRVVPAGTYYVLACVDDGLKVRETDEANNCRASAGTEIG
jgi:hypothetical protein